MINQEQRSEFKSPQNNRASKPVESQDSLKRVISFGSKRGAPSGVGRLLSDNGKKAELRAPVSPQPYENSKPNVNSSDKK